MFSGFRIPSSREDLIRVIAKRRITSNSETLRVSSQPLDKHTLCSMIDSLDGMNLESLPDAAIVWIVEQVIVLCRSGYALESALIIIADYRNKGLGIKATVPSLKGEKVQIMADFIRSRLDAEYATEASIDYKLIMWAVEKSFLFFNKKGCSQRPIAA